MRKEILLKDGYAYIYAPDHPQETMGGYVAYHRLVLEDKLGRLLLPDEIAHHIDGNKYNNSPENITAVTRAEHMRLHKAATACDSNLLRTEYILKRKRIEDIAHDNNCSRQTVMKWMSHFNITKEQQQYELRKQVMSLHNEGFTQAKIANLLNVSQMSVSRCIRDSKLHSD